VGRPSAFSKQLAKTICDRLSLGESLRRLCSDDEMPSKSMVMRWLADNAEFRDQYAHAREAQADHWAEEIIEISDDGTGDVIVDDEGNERVNNDVINRSKLRVDTRKWLMARMAPKKYGDKIQQEHSGSLEIRASKEQRDAAVRAALATSKP
jgi:hypothetical protein